MRWFQPSRVVRFGGEQAQALLGVLLRFDPNPAARGHRGETSIAPRERDRLVRVAGELGDRPERAQAPAGLGVGHVIGEKREVVGGAAHGGWSPDVADGFHGNRYGIPSRSPRTTSTP